MKIKNPEKECKTVPAKLSEISKIVNIKKDEYYNGIILDSPEEFARALIVYNGGSVAEAGFTQKELMDELGSKGGGMGAALLMMGGMLNSDGFIEKLTREAISELKSKGRFYRSFDYDAMGTNFFKTSVLGGKIEDKYILELNAAYVGSEPEKNLAKQINKPMVLINTNAKGILSIVDDWWFNLDLEDIVKKLPVSTKEVEQLSEYIVSGGYSGNNPKMIFKHSGYQFSLKIGLDADKYLRPENSDRESNYMRLRNNNIVGGAWTTWAKDGNSRITPKAVQPSLIFNVTLTDGKDYEFNGITSEQKNLMKEARDYITGFIAPK